MIDPRILYSMYEEIINMKINSLLEENLSYHTVHINLMSRIEFFKPYIDYCTNYKVTELLSMTSIKKFDKIIFKTDKVFINSYTYTKKALELYIKNYININKIIVSNEKKISKLKKQIISYKEYYFIIKNFNTIIADHIVEEGYIFNPGGAFGKLYIDSVHYEKKRVNMGESMKAKKALIEKGIKPYSKEEHNRYKELGKEYDGVEYFVYYPADDYIIRWHRNKVLRKWFPFLMQFKYKAAQSHPNPTAIVNKMRNFIKNTSSDKINVLYNRTHINERAEVS